MPLRLLTTLLLILTLLTACSPYRMPIQQGNIIDEQALSQLQPDMSREQVRFLMGTPVLEHPFRDDRWYYLYYLDTRSHTEQEVLVLHFDGDRLDGMERRMDQPALGQR